MSVLGGHYVLDGREPKRVNTDSLGGLMQWGEFMQTGDRRVGSDYLCGGVHVSTVFLGLDHGWGTVKPVLFETMVFGGDADGETHRYCTWAEAERGHYHCAARIRFIEGKRGYSRSHWRKIRRAVLMADVTNVIPFPKESIA